MEKESHSPTPDDYNKAESRISNKEKEMSNIRLKEKQEERELKQLRIDQSTGNWDKVKKERLLELEGEKSEPSQGNLSKDQWQEYLELTRKQTTATKNEDWTKEQAQRLLELESVRSGERSNQEEKN